MYKYDMWKPEAFNQILPQGVPQIQGQQEKVLYPVQYKNNTGKIL